MQLFLKDAALLNNGRVQLTLGRKDNGKERDDSITEMTVRDYIAWTVEEMRSDDVRVILSSSVRDFKFFDGTSVLIRNGEGKAVEFAPEKGWYDYEFRTSDLTYLLFAGPFATEEELLVAEREAPLT